MPNPSKAKGTSFEVSLLPEIRQWYPGADRNPLHGTKDVGDFNLPGETRFTLEAKNRQVLALPAWLTQASTSARNFHPEAVGIVVHKRKGVAIPGRQYATLEFADLLRLVNGLSRPLKGYDLHSVAEVLT